MELTIPSIYLTKKDCFQTDNRHVLLSPDETFFECVATEKQKKKVYWREQVDPSLTGWINETVSAKKRPGTLLVTKLENYEEEYEHEVYMIYFQSIAFPNVFVAFSMFFDENKKRFYHEKNLGYLFGTKNYHEWGALDYTICDDLFRAAEEYLLNQPLYRLRYVTGDIHKRNL